MHVVCRVQHLTTGKPMQSRRHGRPHVANVARCQCCVLSDTCALSVACTRSALPPCGRGLSESIGSPLPHLRRDWTHHSHARRGRGSDRRDLREERLRQKSGSKCAAAPVRARVRQSSGFWPWLPHGGWICACACRGGTLRGVWCERLADRMRHFSFLFLSGLFCLRVVLRWNVPRCVVAPGG